MLWICGDGMGAPRAGYGGRETTTHNKIFEMVHIFWGVNLLTYWLPVYFHCDINCRTRCYTWLLIPSEECMCYRSVSVYNLRSRKHMIWSFAIPHIIGLVLNFMWVWCVAWSVLSYTIHHTVLNTPYICVYVVWGSRLWQRRDIWFMIYVICTMVWIKYLFISNLTLTPSYPSYPT